jgi:Na+-translocating ferredoxin:NAD+ oxidoreductase RnfD subunit
MAVLEANTRDWERQRSTPKLPWILRTPKGQLLLIFAILLAIASPSEGGLALAPHVIAAVGAACAVDVAYTFWETRRWIVPTSALLSGLIVAFVVGPQEPWLVLVWIGGFASVTKHVLANDREHFFNPAALALLVSGILFGTGQSWWGALGDLPEISSIVLILVGVFLADRLNKFPLVLSFLATYFVAFTGVSLVNASAVAEMFRAPFLQSVLFLAFFMLTDPPTSPNRTADQIWYGVIAAVVGVAAQVLGAGQIYLLVGLLAANVCLAVRRWLGRRPRQMKPHELRRARRMKRTVIESPRGVVIR